MKSNPLFAVAARVLVCCASLLVFPSSTLIGAASRLQSKQPIVQRSSPIFIFYDEAFAELIKRLA